MSLKTMPHTRKAAAVVLGLGAENAAKIYKFLREDEVEALTIEIAKMSDLNSGDMETVMEEFYELCLAQKFITEGGIEYAREILYKAYGTQNADAILDKITKSFKSRAFEFLRKVDPKHILTFLQNEHPQTIALVLSYLNADQVSAVLIELPRELQVNVAERIANMDRTSPEIVSEVEQTLQRRFSSYMSVGLAEIGGIKHVAEILNAVDRSTEKYILEEMGKKDSKLAEEIRNRMFVFEDIATLDPVAIQRFLRDVDLKDLLITLKGASAELAEVFYSNMSNRMRETMMEDAQYLKAVRLGDVEDAQRRLVAIVRKLEEAGEIYISRGRKDEILV